MLHHHLDTITPTHYKYSDKYRHLIYGIHSTPFGQCLIGLIDRKICYLAFINEDSKKDAMKHLTMDWPLSMQVEERDLTGKIVDLIFSNTHKNISLDLLVKGTDFQLKVWRQLLLIPYGTTTTYQEIAQSIGHPRAIRAAASAVGRNSISYLIPCHRVIHKSGKLEGYRWGNSCKKQLLEAEQIEVKDEYTK